MYATASGTNNASCQNCDTTTTPLWRRAEDGTNLCNACGLFLRLHNKPRPITLKSNVIRSRNRVRAPALNKHRKTPYDAPATPGEIARQQQHQQTQMQHQQQHGQPHLSPYEPHPRSLMTSSQQDDSHAQFTENVFDPQLSNPANQVSNPANVFDSNDQDQDAVARELRGRVVELELVNDLFRSQILELEAKLEKHLDDVLEISAEEASPEDLRKRILELQRDARNGQQSQQGLQDQQQESQPQPQADSTENQEVTNTTEAEAAEPAGVQQ